VRLDLIARRESLKAKHQAFLEALRISQEQAERGWEQADRERALNEMEHRAFRETFQTLLAEIARIWGRLAG
jgi:soluble cytochrome b562